jgi:hypothetical protein
VEPSNERLISPSTPRKKPAQSTIASHDISLPMTKYGKTIVRE